jgi:sugar lactone lactonase YvrE
MPRGILVVGSLAAALWAAAQDKPAAPPSWDEGVAAHERHDNAKYLAVFEAFAALAPEHPFVLREVATARALNGKSESALVALEALARMGVFVDLEQADFASLARLPAAARVRESFAALKRTVVSRAQLAFALPETDIVPEGIAWDAARGTFLVSSQYRRQILRLKPDGKATPLTQPAQDGVGMLFGLALDTKSGVVWAVSTADAAMKGYVPADEGKAALVAFDLETGRLVRRLTPAGVRAFDDVALGPDGSVYVSEGTQGEIEVLSPGASELRTLLPPGSISGPQGMAPSADGKRLYVSSYGRGLWVVDVATGKVERLSGVGLPPLQGIDGLVRCGERLIAVQNGLTPVKVLRIDLSADGSGVAAVTTLEQNTTLGEPTLGTIGPDGYYFIGDSQGTKLRRAKGDLAKAGLTPSPVLRLPFTAIGGACAPDVRPQP